MTLVVKEGPRGDHDDPRKLADRETESENKPDWVAWGTESSCTFEIALFRAIDDEFIVGVATNVQDGCALVERGFEYVSGGYNNGGKVFRKRK